MSQVFAWFSLLFLIFVDGRFRATRFMDLAIYIIYIYIEDAYGESPPPP